MVPLGVLSPCARAGEKPDYAVHGFSSLLNSPPQARNKKKKRKKRNAATCALFVFNGDQRDRDNDGGAPLPATFPQCLPAKGEAPL